MIEHLDRIEKLGFVLNINWNRWFDIIYEVEDVPSNSVQFPNDIRVISCVYTPFCGPTFEDIIENTCDFFYEWYNYDPITDISNGLDNSMNLLEEIVSNLPNKLLSSSFTI